MKKLAQQTKKNAAASKKLQAALKPSKKKAEGKVIGVDAVPGIGAVEVVEAPKANQPSQLSGQEGKIRPTAQASINGHAKKAKAAVAKDKAKKVKVPQLTSDEVAEKLYALAESLGWHVEDAAKDEAKLATVGLMLAQVDGAAISKARHKGREIDAATKERVAKLNEARGFKADGKPEFKDEAKEPKAPKAKKEPKPKKEPVGKDRWGCKVNSQAASINALFNGKVITLADMAKASGLGMGRIKGHVKFLVAKGFVVARGDGYLSKEAADAAPEAKPASKKAKAKK